MEARCQVSKLRRVQSRMMEERGRTGTDGKSRDGNASLGDLLEDGRRLTLESETEEGSGSNVEIRVGGS
jgi:hypothetical protein